MIDVEDDFIVKHVLVHIYNGSGRLVEKGEASIIGDDLFFTYTTQRRNVKWMGGRIEVYAADMACNMVGAEMHLIADPQKTTV
ncbi:hypothetical protein MKQ70_12540 [Chitinophaga sedimenti]|uniref:hypothetical protein n=1 Tax=Chitinophaga sedimenti TaxID=2033606 RepID=UPI002006B993|nr:hypothetical protein [Chitinophaga sedimenti]MCK7555800.1 hypothetical protein [Chitinophaga sedimenti]